MGLLDSNLYSGLQRSGSFTCDLTTAGSQNPISFGGAGYATMRLFVSGAPSGSNFAIKVKGAIVSNAQDCNIFDKNGVAIANNRITENGEYFVDIVGITSLYFYVNIRPDSGSATINWSVSNVRIDSDRCRDILEESGVLSADVLSEKKIYSLASVANLQYYDVDTNKHKCLLLYVDTISSGANLSLFRNYNHTLDIYDISGNIYHGHIYKTGFYYIHVGYPTGASNKEKITLRNETAIEDGSISVTAYYLRDFPKEITETKPVQEIAYKEFNVSSSGKAEVFSYTETADIVNFKYYFVAYTVKNGSSVVPRNIVLSAVPYASSAFYFKEENIIESGASREHSEWRENHGVAGVRFYAAVSNYQEGDKLLIGVYGIR